MSREERWIETEEEERIERLTRKFERAGRQTDRQRRCVTTDRCVQQYLNEERRRKKKSVSERGRTVEEETLKRRDVKLREYQTQRERERANMNKSVK